MVKKIIILCCSVLCMFAAKAQQPLNKDDVQFLITFGKKLAGGKPADTAAAKQKITALLNAKGEKELLMASKLAAFIKQPALADSINAAAIAAYPTGWVAFLKGYSKVMLLITKDPAKKVALYEDWIKRFPEPPGKSDSHYDNARADIAIAFAQARDVKNNKKWLAAIKGDNFKLFNKQSSSQVFFQQGDTAIAETMMHEVAVDAKILLDKPSDSIGRTNYHIILANLARMLYKEGKYKEALAPATEAYEASPAPINIREIYGFVLTENGRGREVLPLLSDLVKSGKAEPDHIKELRSAYIQSKGNLTGFDELLASLTATMRRNVQAKLNDQMLSLEAPLFSLVDVLGKRAALSDYKGKVVVLDFWATWCSPCKKSFPAMQMALNKYKNDPNVVFLFIDTWERLSDPTAAVREFIKQNKYTFRVLLDNQSSGIVDRYGIQTIPAKFVIDGNGKIRFKLTGFIGTNEAAVEKLSQMIEAAKKAG